MNSFMQPFARKISALAGLLLISASVQGASIVNLTDGNSSATVNLGSQAGMSQWLINGQNQLNQQWFWYRIGNDPTGQHSIDTIGGLSYVNNANSVIATYTAATFSLEITYVLNGGVAGGSD